MVNQKPVFELTELNVFITVHMSLNRDSPPILPANTRACNRNDRINAKQPKYYFWRLFQDFNCFLQDLECADRVMTQTLAKHVSARCVFSSSIFASWTGFAGGEFCKSTELAKT